MGLGRRFAALLSLILIVVPQVHETHAAPSISVTQLGLNGNGNREWRVDALPDASLFTQQIGGLGGSLAVELGFSVSGTTFVGGTKNSAAWPFDNPGNNPFTGNVTDGIVVGGANLFASLGSDFFTAASPVQLLTLETLGSAPATLSWGGQTLLPGSPHEYVGGRIAQGGKNFNNITGNLTSTVPGDLNADGAVDALDAGMMFSVWDTNDSLGDINADGIVDAADAGIMFGNWTGDPATPTSNQATAEYNAVSGELKVSSAGAVNLFVQSASGKITPLNPAPVPPIGLLTNNANRVGLTNLGPIQLNNYSFGSIGAGLPMQDLKLVFTTALGQKSITVDAGTAQFAYIPEPSGLVMLGLGLASLLITRQGRAG